MWKGKHIMNKKIVIGIDVGGSTTKIVGFAAPETPAAEHNLIAPIFVKANDPITSIYGAFGKFLDENNLDLEDISEATLYFWVSYHDSENDDDDTVKDDVVVGEYEVKYEENIVFKFTGTKVSAKYDQDLSEYGI
jgi:N-acetylglucosamine kinase-like BadF-type ATPase